jgi:poly(3-hydroxybutyrate) depolymerase
MLSLPSAAVSLPSFNVLLKQTSVSGLSPGGFMAAQFSVAYSSIVKGAGIVAGGSYY